MPVVATGLSVVDLERILDERRAQLQDLAKRRDQVQRELDSINAELQGLVVPGGPVSRRRRLKNETSLRAVALQILGKNKKGLSLSDLSTKVTESGYRSASKNFRNVLYQCLYNTEGIVHDDATGRYRLEQ